MFNATLTNDIIFGNTDNSGTDTLTSNLGGSNVSETNCDIPTVSYPGTGDISADPLFVNAPTDLHLKSGSPCTGAGTATAPAGVTVPATDLDGKTRPNPPSIGAYEGPPLPTGPQITAVTPPSANHGSAPLTLVLTGTNFAAGAAVSFNGQALSGYTVSADGTTITVSGFNGQQSPAGTYLLTVNNNDGSKPATANFYVNPAGPPSVTSLSPVSVPARSPAFPLTIKGANLSWKGTVSLAVGGGSFTVLSGPVYSNDGTSVTVTVPAADIATTGTDTVKVDNNDGQTPATATLSVTAPVARFSVSAPSTATAGSAVTITVTALDAAGNTATGYTGTVHLSSSDSAAFLPADYTFTTADKGVHVFSVTLWTAGSQTLTAADAASISGTSGPVAVTIPAPTLTSLTPNHGPVGTSVTLTGAHLTGATAVKFNGTSAMFSVTTDALITATVPTGVTMETVSVTTPGGTAASAAAFTVTASPQPPVTLYSLNLSSHWYFVTASQSEDASLVAGG